MTESDAELVKQLRETKYKVKAYGDYEGLAYQTYPVCLKAADRIEQLSKQASTVTYDDVIEECAKAVKGWCWAHNESGQTPEEVIRSLKFSPSQQSTTVTDEMVEDAARAAWDKAAEQDGGESHWPNLSENIKIKSLEQNRAALEAALKVKP